MFFCKLLVKLGKFLSGTVQLPGFFFDDASKAADFDSETTEIGCELFDTFLLAAPLFSVLLLAAMIRQRIGVPSLLPIGVVTHCAQFKQQRIQPVGDFVVASRCGLQNLNGAVELNLGLV